MARKLTIDTSIATDIKSAASDSFKDNIKMIEIGKIKESMDNFYSLSDIEILAEDIERQGLKHNLVVVEDSNEPDTYFIKSGHRRFTAIKQLVRENKYSSKFVPCLVDGSKTKDENILDLIMLNATTRVMTDSELYKQYEVLKETLERLKADGMKVKGRLRDKVAEALNVSPAQVGKIENIKHNAVDEVKEAVKNGDMTIATADSIAKLPEEDQAEIVTEKPVAEITTKDVKERSEKKAETSSYERKGELVKWDGAKYEDVIKKTLLAFISEDERKQAWLEDNNTFTDIIRKAHRTHCQQGDGVLIKGSFDKITISFFNNSGIDDINTYYLTWSMAARHIRMWVSEEHSSQMAAKSENNETVTHDVFISNDDYIELPSDDEIKASAQKNKELTEWAQSLSQEQINFLCDSGFYNRAIKGYLIAAAENADLSNEQLNALQNGLSIALDDYNKAAAENKFLSR
jgi:ParB-like chromosome segregation protein Spo0J